MFIKSAKVVLLALPTSTFVFIHIYRDLLSGICNESHTLSSILHILFDLFGTMLKMLSICMRICKHKTASHRNTAKHFALSACSCGS